MAKTCHKNSGTWSDAGKKFVRELSVETKDVCLYILGRECVKSAYPGRQTKTFENISILKYLGVTQTNETVCTKTLKAVKFWRVFDNIQ
jgi:hypothetical protein